MGTVVMGTHNFTIWGKPFELTVKYNRCVDKEPVQQQRDALKKFVGNNSVIDVGLTEIKNYCLERDLENIPNGIINDIFEYVKPKSIYIDIVVNGTVLIGLMCDYIFDEDDGIAVVFKDGKFLEVGSQNIIL